MWLTYQAESIHGTHTRVMRKPKSIAALFAIFILCLPARANDVHEMRGRVVRIVDGDTIVLDAQGTKHKVRLAGIDAPERNQPWGEAATRELRRQVAGQQVVVAWTKKDRWQRLIGVIRLDGEDQNLHLVDRGLAWHYKKYADEQSQGDRDAYSAAEKAAQGAGRGLWSDPAPIPPWEWRKRN